MLDHLPALRPDIREVIGAWLVCLIMAAGCFTLLSATSVGSDGWPEALISRDPAATVDVAKADRAAAHKQGRC
jgi:hypothetical protein